MKTLLFILMSLLGFLAFTNGQQRSNKTQRLKVITDSVYIPTSLEDCFVQLDKIFPDSSKEYFKTIAEDQFSSQMHFGFGMWMRNNWGLWRGSQLAKYFHNKGIHHADDMSGIILDSYHRYLMNKEVKLEEQIADCKAYWEKAKKEELERRRQKMAEYHVGDTILFNYRHGFASKAQEQKYDTDACNASGIIVEKNAEQASLKVRIVEDCDKRGVIYYDNEDHLIYNNKTKKMEKPKKRTIRYIKRGEERWFDFTDWELYN